ncbi:MAG: malonyl CoA-acyl carrier protein transacylase [Geminicoccaceae bacterium]|nr:malonyl CoA-acyl carrier protein transacylase [Geminicoccaceae bacterium]
MNVVLLFPGQGSQKPGMAKDLVNAVPLARETFAAVDAALGQPLGALCFEGPAETLTLTHNAQPALLAHGAAVWAVVKDRVGPLVRAAAGHSLGEFSAYHAAGALSLADAVRLVRRRGELMLASGGQRPGTMAAILGDVNGGIEALCARASGEGGCVVPANYNSPGQVVISGEVAAVERAMEMAKAAGAKRAIRLNVSGAFHSPLMDVARDGLRAAIEAADFREPAFPVYANVSGEPVRAASDARRLLFEQLTSPVRWTTLVERLAAEYPDALYVEMGPGSVLVGLVKKIAPHVQTMTCGTVAEVDQLLSHVS